MASQAFEKSKAGHPLVPKDVYQRRHGLEDYIHLELRDPITQIAHFLEEVGFEKTLLALKSEASENNVQINLDLYRSNIAGLAEHSRSSLMEMWNGIVLGGGDGGMYPRPRLLAFAEEAGPSFGEVLTVDIEEEEKDSDSSDDDSDSSTDSPAKAGQKRKRIMTPSSSDGSSSDSDSDSDSGDEKTKDGASNSSSSDSDSDSDSSSDDERPTTKRTKVSHPADDEPKVTASSDSEDDAAPLQKRSKNKAAKKPVKDNSSSSDSDSDSSSDSSSDSGRSAKRKSSSGSSSSSSSGSSSSSSSDSDSDSGSSSSSSSSGSSSSSSDSDSDSSSSSSSPAPKKSKKLKKKSKLAKADSKRSGSTSSSATLVGDNDVKVKKTTDTLLVPDSTSNIGTKAVPATKENVKQLKKDHIPFSRIPTGQNIDPRFSSNEYISYDYADRAYQDLSVTKGKGFTKEKNKKKRGAYRGGAIDLTPKGIKFED